MGEAEDLSKACSVLNRQLAWTPDGVTIEADPRHVDQVVKCLELERANPAMSPGIPGEDEVNPNHTVQKLKSRKMKASRGNRREVDGLWRRETWGNLEKWSMVKQGATSLSL